MSPDRGADSPLPANQDPLSSSRVFTLARESSWGGKVKFLLETRPCVESKQRGIQKLESKGREIGQIWNI